MLYLRKMPAKITGGQSPCEVFDLFERGISGVTNDGEADTCHAGELADTATIYFGFVQDTILSFTGIQLQVGWMSEAKSILQEIVYIFVRPENITAVEIEYRFRFWQKLKYQLVQFIQGHP